MYITHKCYLLDSFLKLWVSIFHLITTKKAFMNQLTFSVEQSSYKWACSHVLRLHMDTWLFLLTGRKGKWQKFSFCFGTTVLSFGAIWWESRAVQQQMAVTWEKQGWVLVCLCVCSDQTVTIRLVNGHLAPQEMWMWTGSVAGKLVYCSRALPHKTNYHPVLSVYLHSPTTNLHCQRHFWNPPTSMWPVDKYTF